MSLKAKGWFGTRLLIVPMAVALVGLPGCGGTSGEFCDLVCDCTGCNDEEHELCIADADHEAERASILECDVEYDDLVACALENNNCEDDVFVVDSDCNGEAVDYGECID